MVWRNDQVSQMETKKIIDLAKDALLVDGDFVEFGCYKGDTSLLIAEILLGTSKKLWLYDSFEGLPEKTVEDYSEIGRDFKKGELLASKKELKKRFLRAGLKVPIIKSGWFSDLNRGDIPDKISFAFIDCDLYDSTKAAFKLVEKNIVNEGIILVHDYNNVALPGVAKFVDGWNANGEHKVEIFDTMAVIRN